MEGMIFAISSVLWFQSWWKPNCRSSSWGKEGHYATAALVSSLMQVISCSGYHSQSNCSVNLENRNALKNSFGIKVSNQRKHKKAFRSKIFSFTMCGNNHFKKWRAKTLRWLNLDRCTQACPAFPQMGMVGEHLISPGLHGVSSPGGGGGGGGFCFRNKEPMDADCFRFQAFGSAVLYH